jgi:hypothetical protein
MLLAGAFPRRRRNFPWKAMSEHEKFAVPHEIEEILDRLPPRVTLHVPDHILSLWFPPGPANGVMEGRALARVLSYAKSCACEFAYHGDRGEGVFSKAIPSED